MDRRSNACSTVNVIVIVTVIVTIIVKVNLIVNFIVIIIVQVKISSCMWGIRVKTRGCRVRMYSLVSTTRIFDKISQCKIVDGEDHELPLKIERSRQPVPVDRLVAFAL